jgi:iron complex transport system ATP-binding protein
MPILKTHNLSIGYLRRKQVYVVQKDLNIELKAGELVCLIGPNGAGKSTLLRTLSGLQKSIVGSVVVDSLSIDKLSLSKKALLISLVLTEKVEIDNTTVYDLVAFGRHPYSNLWGSKNDEDEISINEAIQLVHLENKRDSLINELSDGEKQRALIAKALAQDTPIIMLDEPTAHLDLPNRVEIMLLLHRLAHKTDKAILLSTHELDLALQAADKIWLMGNDGLKCGVPEDLVFNGSFNETFESKSYFFNTSNGNFSMNYPMTKQVSVKGDKLRMYWTFRALARAGYEVVESAPVEIRIAEMSWKVADKEFLTVEELLKYLDGAVTQ